MEIDDTAFDKEAILTTPTAMPDYSASAKAEEYLANCKADTDSAGGVIECVVNGLPAGIGDPVFEKLDANLSKALFSIGAVKAVEIGDGFKVASVKGSENNDAFAMENGTVVKKTNHAGGILGGMSDGDTLIARAYIKPTPSIFKKQETVNKSGEEIEIQIKGRHDPVIVPRAVVVVEAMAALTIVDLMFTNMAARLDGIKEFYKR